MLLKLSYGVLNNMGGGPVPMGYPQMPQQQPIITRGNLMAGAAVGAGVGGYGYFKAINNAAAKNQNLTAARKATLQGSALKRGGKFGLGALAVGALGNILS